MERQVFEKYNGEQVTQVMLEEAAVLFSENYGIWGESATGKFAKPGKLPQLNLTFVHQPSAGSRVRLSKDRLRTQCLPDNATCSYVRVTVDGKLAGNAFACRWKVNNKSVCWVTQLVVDRNYRERGLAKGLLNQLRQDDVDMYGLMSSHPAACMAAAKAFGGKHTEAHNGSTLKTIGSIETVRLGFIGKYAQEIMEASPIGYVKDAKLRGSVFTPNDTTGLVSSVDSGFFVDHAEPLEALAWVREDMEWPLGELFNGHEFLLILEARRRSRSRSTSRPKSGIDRT